jgi:hypothetical protein
MLVEGVFFGKNKDELTNEDRPSEKVSAFVAPLFQQFGPVVSHPPRGTPGET